MTYDDWRKLGTKYPNTQNIWIIDASYLGSILPVQGGASQFYWYSKQGDYFGNFFSTNCNGWTNGGSGGTSILANTNTIVLTGCLGIRKLACVY